MMNLIDLKVPTIGAITTTTGTILSFELTMQIAQIVAVVITIIVGILTIINLYLKICYELRLRKVEKAKKKK